ncbi:MAG: DegT/DnrJ/EryC1/StrS family aminotransferase [Planctomycetota bacterium]
MNPTAPVIALNGGKPAKTTPYGTGSRFNSEEEEAAVAAIRSQKLWYKQGGTRVLATEKTICELWNTKHAILCSSGCAAVHTALVMCGVGPGDEVIVNPVSDWGSLMGILALGATPVFCDIDADTYSLDPQCVERAITARTRAIELVHLSGYPAHVQQIVAMAHARGIKVIEDCAQSPLASVGGRVLGTFADVGAFSTNDSKHVSCGEGGFVITSDDIMASIARLFIDKAYSRDAQRGRTDVAFLGFNYRLSELSAAVLDVQLRKLPKQLKQRRVYAERLLAGLAGVAGYTALQTSPETQGGYWTVLGHLDLSQFRVSRDDIVKALHAEGIPVWAALAPARTLYGISVVQSGIFSPYQRGGRASSLPDKAWRPEDFPVAERIVDSVLPLHCSPFFSARDADETASGVRKVLQHYHA